MDDIYGNIKEHNLNKEREVWLVIYLAIKKHQEIVAKLSIRVKN